MCEAMAKGSLSGLCSHRLAYVGHAAWKILRAGPAQVLRQESQRTGNHFQCMDRAFKKYRGREYRKHLAWPGEIARGLQSKKQCYVGKTWRRRGT